MARFLPGGFSLALALSLVLSNTGFAKDKKRIPTRSEIATSAKV